MNAEIIHRLDRSFSELSLPDWLMGRVEEAAAKNRHPVETELVHRVLDSFALEERPQPDELREMLEAERAKSDDLRKVIAEYGGIPPIGSMAALQRSVEELQNIVRVFGEAIRGREAPVLHGALEAVESHADAAVAQPQSSSARRTTAKKKGAR